jgi:hypothetical protein
VLATQAFPREFTGQMSIAMMSYSPNVQPLAATEGALQRKLKNRYELARRSRLAVWAVGRQIEAAYVSLSSR